MTLQQLRYIVEISKCGSLTGAAQALFIAQPSLSKAVKDLEKEFGLILLDRNRRGVAFTPEGMEFLQYANRILEQTHNLQEHFQPDRAERELHLSISAQHYMFVVDALIYFIRHIETSPRYTLSIREGRTSQVIQDVLVQQSQIGILFVSHVTHHFMKRLFDKNGLDFIPFQEFPPYVYLNRHHPLARYEDLSIEQLRPYPYVKYEQGMDSYQFSEEVVIPEITSKKTIYVTDRSTMLSILAHTDAYNIGTGCLIPHISGEAIISLPLRNRTDHMQLGWIKLRNMAMAPELQTYVTMLAQALQRCTEKEPSL